MITGFEPVGARISTQHSPVNTISDRQTRSTDPGAILSKVIQRDGLIHDDLHGYTETPSAYPAHSSLAFLMLSSTRPATSTRSTYVLASAARTGAYDGESGLDAQNFGSNCTTAIRAPEMRFEDMMVFGDVLHRRDTR